jgi:dihydrofolate reductase
MGSGSIVAPLAAAGLVDEFQLVMIPIAIGKGRTMFEGISERLSLKPTRTRTFRNGRVLVCYQPADPGADATDNREARRARPEHAEAARSE